MENRGGHVIPLAAIRREFADLRENMAQKVQGGFAGMAQTGLLDTLYAKLLFHRIPRMGQAMGTEKHGIARLQL
jgi:hypothetical protein